MSVEREIDARLSVASQTPSAYLNAPATRHVVQVVNARPSTDSMCACHSDLIVVSDLNVREPVEPTCVVEKNPSAWQIQLAWNASIPVSVMQIAAVRTIPVFAPMMCVEAV